ncbi:MAG TPA: hypothetical protein VF190_01250 [Rhodothermales bacterium]
MSVVTLHGSAIQDSGSRLSHGLTISSLARPATLAVLLVASLMPSLRFASSPVVKDLSGFG